jgi:hypothetical protein
MNERRHSGITRTLGKTLGGCAIYTAISHITEEASQLALRPQEKLLKLKGWRPLVNETAIRHRRKRAFACADQPSETARDLKLCRMFRDHHHAQHHYTTKFLRASRVATHEHLPQPLFMRAERN